MRDFLFWKNWAFYSRIFQFYLQKFFYFIPKKYAAKTAYFLILSKFLRKAKSGKCAGLAAKNFIF